MKKMRDIFFLIFGFILISSCSYEFPPSGNEPDYTLSNLDFDSMVILGSSISAGFMDGALYDEGQSNSYGAQFASLLEQRLERKILTPIAIDSQNGFNILTGNNDDGRFYLSFRNPTQNWPARFGEEGDSVNDFSEDLTNIDNFSIPLLKIYQVDDASLLSENIYFDRIAKKDVGESILDLALNKNPSLFIFEPGFEDIFGYAISGASGINRSSPSTALYSDLTSESLFEQKINEVVDRIMNETSTELFLVNIPDPFSLPYFSTIPWYYPAEEWNIVVNSAFSPFGEFNEFNTKVQSYNQFVSFSERRPLITFDNNGGRDFRAKVIEDEYLIDATDNQGQEIPKWRQMTEQDYFLYNAEKTHNQTLLSPPVFGSIEPIQDLYVISEGEADLISERREYFNSLIEDIVNGNDRIHLIDFDRLLDNVKNQSISYKGVTFSLRFDKKGIISADGFTLNARGHALLANEIIKIINANYGTTIESIDVNNQRGTVIRNQF